MHFIKLLSYAFTAITLFAVSCKKSDKTIITPICSIDSISVISGFSFHFINENNRIKEAYSYFNGEPFHKITYTYSGDYLIGQSFYFYIAQNISRKYSFQYEGDLLISITEYKFNTITLNFYKSYASAFSYVAGTLSSGKVLAFSPNDSINPSATIAYNFFGANGNADSAVAVSTTYIPLKFQVSNKENPLRKNYNFLTTPTLELNGILFNPKYFPFFLNKNYTLSYVNKYLNGEYTDLRVDANASGQPTYFYLTGDNSLYIWDYFYKCN